MTSQILDRIRVITSGIFLTLFVIFIFGETKGQPDDLNLPQLFTLNEEVADDFSPAIDWQNILVSGSNSTSVFSIEKNKSQVFGSDFISFLSPLHFIHSFQFRKSGERLEIISLMDQMHHIFFFF
jgi:hypothetical protein